ncbi:hypothetical protein B1C78_16485 [Thioalkalivibrio denitrificans]|uniref:STAS domain-containing protein n=1 Tax=Thioalkalivibrio denitrificans TaxID=108003 RepID=A0A1V3N8I9_9GAMM|nr:hypothetical protein [Thioalkalivibrio denitrificans]OOG21218.1 hypothetical protein B1C78_16485 [Thioalkalivibrio denitrificans]
MSKERIQGMHLTPIGGAVVLLEPGDGLDPTDADAYLEPLASYLQVQEARRLIYDLATVPVIDGVYYDWLKSVHAICAICGVEMVVAGMTPSAAYALAHTLNETPPFACALNVDRAR